MAARRPALTIRARITIVATAVVACVLGVTSVVLVAVLSGQLTESLDDSLEQRAAELAAIARAGGDMPASGPSADEDAFSAVVAAGESTPAVPEGFRSLEVDVDTPTGPVTVVVASSTEDRDEPVGVLVASLAVAVPVVVAVLGVVVWLLVGRTLAPVEAMRAEVAEISAERLDRRVPEPGGGDEVQRLARTMNEMLDRLEAADRRLRRFTADASHELRTPLTRMRTELEVDLAGGSGRSQEQLERSLLAEVLHLQAMVEGLLAMARLDAGVGGFEPVPVDLDDIVLREAEQSRAALEAAGSTVTLRVSRVSAALVEGDPLQLASVVRNLLDNACRHADSEVEVVLSEQGDSVVLEVSDDGPGVPESAREVVFEPFGRAEESRSTAGGGPGLGLAIVREVAIRHGGSAELVDRAPGAGARFRVVLPRGSGSRTPLVDRTPVR